MKILEHVPLILIYYSYGSNICDYKPTSRESLHGASSNTPSSASFDILSIIADLPWQSPRLCKDFKSYN